MPGLQDNAHNPLELAPEGFILVAPSDSTALMATSSSSAASSTFHTDRAYSRWYPLKTNKKAQAFHAALAKLNAIGADATDARAAILKEAIAYLVDALNNFEYDSLVDTYLPFDIRPGKYSANTGVYIYNCLQPKFTTDPRALLVAAIVLNLPHVVVSLLDDPNLRNTIKSYNSSPVKYWKYFEHIIFGLLIISIQLLDYEITDILIKYINNDIDKKITKSQGSSNPNYARKNYFPDAVLPLYAAMQTNEVIAGKIIAQDYPYFFIDGDDCVKLWDYLQTIYHPQQLKLINYLYNNNLAFFKLSNEGFISVFSNFPLFLCRDIKNGTTILNPYNTAVFNLIIGKLLDCLDKVYGIDWYKQKLTFRPPYQSDSDLIDNVTPENHDDYTEVLTCDNLSYLDTNNKARLLPAAIAIIPRLEAQQRALEEAHRTFTDYVKNILMPAHENLQTPSPLTQLPNIDPNYREATTFERVHPVVLSLHTYIQDNQTRLITVAASILNELCKKRQQLIDAHPSLVSLHRMVLNNPLREIHLGYHYCNSLERMYPMIRRVHDDILSLTLAGILEQQQAETNRLREENQRLTERIALLTRTSTCSSALFPSSSSAFDEGIPAAAVDNHTESSESESDSEVNHYHSSQEVARPSRKHERLHGNDSDSSEKEELRPPKFMRGSHSRSP